VHYKFCYDDDDDDDEEDWSDASQIPLRVRVFCERPLSFLQDGVGFSIAARRARQWPVQHPMWQCGRTSRDDVSESGGVQRV